MAKINGTSGNDTLNGTLIDDLLYGYGGNDQLRGYEGDDTLDGGSGSDSMIGGTGDDLYYVDNAGDKVTENSGEGIDAVISSITYTLGTNVEHLVLSGTANINGTGNGLDNIIIGNSGANRLSGLGGNDILDGGAGKDVMLGGMGNDFYIVDNPGDIVTEAPNEGIDGVGSFINYTLGANIEVLVLAEGTANINGTGNDLENEIYGNDGNNVLDGGAGVDTMEGGAGDDTFIVNTMWESVIEEPGEGTDLVISSVAYILGENIENLTLTGIFDFNGTGNDLNNVITGNSGNNTLDGGTGEDTMAGSAGNDIYIVNSSGDIVTELAGEGTDLVNSSASYILSGNIEKLTLTGTAGINGTGNSLDNEITGNSGNNILRGGAGNDTLGGGAGNDTVIGGIGNDTLDGGAGNDTMIGGIGNDTYIVDAVGDIVTENAGEGTDTVISSVTNTLSGNIEKLTLTGTAGINGTGNSLDNEIIGNSGNNVLRGEAGNDTLNGGAGNDTMIGGIGNDTYIVNAVGDIVMENAGEGMDTVISSVTYTLSGNIENLTLTGIASINGPGNNLDNVITGNKGNNILSGGAGNDTLNGGAGDDTLTGGIGWDTLSGGWGNDELFGGAGNDTLNGGDGLNELYGEAGNDILIGGPFNDLLDGGIGNDTMSGGQCNDNYWVDSTGDVVIEKAGEGFDSINSSITYTLGDNIEKLILTGTNNIDGTGNSLDNVIVGNSADNTLNGGIGNDYLNGNGGVDTLVGGTGDDRYEVDSNDTLLEAPEEGTDVAICKSSYSLVHAANVENLTLMETPGNKNFNGTGNSLDNEIIGNSGDNILRGGAGNDTLNGGGGNDTLSGGSGSDTFVYSGFAWYDFYELDVSAPHLVITDFTLGAGNDLLDLTCLYTGADADYLLFAYDSSTGDTTVSFDDDGPSGLAPIELVVLKGVQMTLANTDNYIV